MGLFHSLYITETLGFTRGEFGQIMKYGPLFTLTLAIPAGWLVDKIGGQKAMMSAFALSLSANAALLGFARSEGDLIAVQCITVAGNQLYFMSYTKLLFTVAAAEERGNASGLMGFARSLAAFFATLIIGHLAEAMHSYTAGYLGALGVYAAGVCALAVHGVWDKTSGSQPTEK
jgi:sugar phosphate permease